MIQDLLLRINQFILNPIIALLFAIAFLYFFYGIFQFIASQTADSKREEGKRKIFYGLVGMFIMFSAYGLIGLVLDVLGVEGPSILGI